MSTTDRYPEDMTLKDVKACWTKLDEIHQYYLTCVNHPTAVYSTKNPWSRSIHFLQPCREYFDDPENFKSNGSTGIARMECACPFNDLKVVCDSHGVPI